MACTVHDALDRLAALVEGISVTLSDGTVVEAVGPRRGIGAGIPETPFLEVDAYGVDVEEQGVGCVVSIRARIIVSVRFGHDPARETETLNRIFCEIRSRVRADPTLGGLVEAARVLGFDRDLVTVEGREFWAMMVKTEVRYREC